MDRFGGLKLFEEFQAKRGERQSRTPIVPCSVAVPDGGDPPKVSTVPLARLCGDANWTAS